MMCAVALRLKISGHVWKRLSPVYFKVPRFLDSRRKFHKSLASQQRWFAKLQLCTVKPPFLAPVKLTVTVSLCVSFYSRFQEKTLMTIRWVPEAFLTRFPVLVKSKKSDPREFFLAALPFVSSACGRPNSSSHTRKNLWGPEYDDKDFLHFFNVSSLFTKQQKHCFQIAYLHVTKFIFDSNRRCIMGDYL